MTTQLLPRWPVSLPRNLTDRARVKGLPRRSPREEIDLLYLEEAYRLARETPQCSGLTGTWSECFFTNTADHTAVASTASESSLLAGTNQQPVLPSLFFNDTRGVGRAISVLARGVFSNTGTPTLIFQVRLGTTAGSSDLTGTSVGVSAAITTQSGVTNKWWELRLDLQCRVPGIGTGNTTLAGSGYVTSPTGFASPFIYPLEPTTPDTATWTATLNAALTQYMNLSVTWSASSASNTITLKQLYVLGLN